jgi:hypothetical protein
MYDRRRLSSGTLRGAAGLLAIWLAGAGCTDTGGSFDGGGKPFVDQLAPGAEGSAGAEASTPVDGSGGASGKMYAHSGDKLLEIDPTTLQVTLVGSFAPNAPHMNDLAITPNGEMYVLSSSNLYKVEASTAKITWVAAVAGTSNVALTFEVKGTLLASDKTGALRRIDPKTGVVTEIGTYGSGLGSSGDLVAIKDGTLYGVDDVSSTAYYDNQLLTVDPSTGKATVIGSIGFKQVWGLAFWKGTVYGLTKGGDFIAIDPKTGKGTLIKNLPYEFWGAAVTPLAPIS